jgi:hypothetical protein
LISVKTLPKGALSFNFDDAATFIVATAAANCVGQVLFAAIVAAVQGARLLCMVRALGVFAGV